MLWCLLLLHFPSKLKRHPLKPLWGHICQLGLSFLHTCISSFSLQRVPCAVQLIFKPVGLLFIQYELISFHLWLYSLLNNSHSLLFFPFAHFRLKLFAPFSSLNVDNNGELVDHSIESFDWQLCKK